MKTYKWKILGLESLLIGILFFALFVPNILSRYFLVVILLLYVFILDLQNVHPVRFIKSK